MKCFLVLALFGAFISGCATHNKITLGAIKTDDMVAMKVKAKEAEEAAKDVAFKPTK